MMFSSSQIRQQIFSAVRAVIPTGRLCLYRTDANLEPCDFRFDDGDTRWIPVYPRFAHLDPFHPRHFGQHRNSVFSSAQGAGTTAQREAYLRGFLQPMGMSFKMEAFLRDPEGCIVGGVLPDLTPRESEVFHRLLVGQSNKQIALELSMALPTVKTHVKSILYKADRPNRVALIARYR